MNNILKAEENQPEPVLSKDALPKIIKDPEITGNEPMSQENSMMTNEITQSKYGFSYKR